MTKIIYLREIILLVKNMTEKQVKQMEKSNRGLQKRFWAYK